MANPRSTAEALAWYAAQEPKAPDPQWINGCDGLCAEAYGWSYSGEASARSHWNNIPSSSKTATKDVGSAPVGYLVFFAPNHVATSCGDGTCWTNDVVHMGSVDRVRISNITNGAWHLTPLGYSPPIFPHAGGRSAIPPLNPKGLTLPMGPGVGPVAPGEPIAAAAPGNVSPAIEVLSSVSFWQRMMIGLLGAALIITALYMLSGKSAVDALTTITGGTTNGES